VNGSQCHPQDLTTYHWGRRDATSGGAGHTAGSPNGLSCSWPTSLARYAPEAVTNLLVETLAKVPVRSLTAEFDPDKYTDDYRVQVLDLIGRKAAGEEFELPAVADEKPKIVDMMAALEASVEAAKAARKRHRPPVRRRLPASPRGRRHAPRRPSRGPRRPREVGATPAATPRHRGRYAVIGKAGEIVLRHLGVELEVRRAAVQREAFDFDADHDAVSPTHRWATPPARRARSMPGAGDGARSVSGSVSTRRPRRREREPRRRRPGRPG
jgi:hypothetical protein